MIKEALNIAIHTGENCLSPSISYTATSDARGRAQDYNAHLNSAIHV